LNNSLDDMTGGGRNRKPGAFENGGGRVVEVSKRPPGTGKGEGKKIKTAKRREAPPIFSIRKEGNSKGGPMTVKAGGCKGENGKTKAEKGKGRKDSVRNWERRR